MPGCSDLFRRSLSAGWVRRSQRRCSASQLSRTLARESAAATSDKAVPREPWHLIRIPDPLARRATIAALESASARLADADCRKILTDFDDGNGRSLADRLSSVAVDVHVYLTMVTFIDDSRHAEMRQRSPGVHRSWQPRGACLR